MGFHPYKHSVPAPFLRAKEWGRFVFFLSFILAVTLPTWSQDAARQAASLSRQAAKAFHGVMNVHRGDSIAYYQQVVEGMRLSLKSDSLDLLPDKKGRTKPRWQEENAARIVVLHPLLINAGIYFSHNHYPGLGADALKLYVASRSHPALKGEPDESGVAYYYLSTIYFQSRGFHQADLYADRAMEYDDVALPAAEMKARCMHETMTSEADSLRYVAVLKELYAVDPTNLTYFSWIMKFYEHPTPRHHLDQFIDSQLEENPHSVTPWILKGEVAMHNRHWMEAVEAYREADAIDATSVPVIYNIGLSLTYEAHDREVEEHNAGDVGSSNALPTDSLWGEACRYLERVREMDPRRNKVDWVTPLYAVYLKLGRTAEAEELEPLVKKR